MIRTPAPETMADTRPGDVVEIADRPGGASTRVVRVEWRPLGCPAAMCVRYSEGARIPLSGGTCMHFLVPNHVEVLRVIDPDAPLFTAPEQGDPNGER